MSRDRLRPGPIRREKGANRVHPKSLGPCFQTFKARLTETKLNFEVGGRNTYPDFRLVATTDGFEVKGLAYPGREANYDCNSQVPSGTHNGRTIYYVFGRYPAEPDGNTYPVLDLVVCHGDFLNLGATRRAKAGGPRSFESWGGMLVRGCKRYIAPTPFALTTGTAHSATLILPTGTRVDDRLQQVGRLVRREPEKLVIGYAFDARANTLVPELTENPFAGREHVFAAYRLKGVAGEEVAMRPLLGDSQSFGRGDRWITSGHNAPERELSFRL